MDLEIVEDHVEFKDISSWLVTLVNPPARALFLYTVLGNVQSSCTLFLKIVKEEK